MFFFYISKVKPLNADSVSSPPANLILPPEVLEVLFRVCSKSAQPFFTSLFTLPLTSLSRFLNPSVRVNSKPTFLIKSVLFSASYF